MGFKIGIGLSISRHSGGASYDPDASALFARFTTPPTDARKTLINNLIVSLKAAGVWAKLDMLSVMAAADAQAARQNWIADQYNLTPVSAPTFTADRGYTGDGVASYLDTGFNPATAVSPKFTQNNASLGFWSRTELISTSQNIGNSNTVIQPRNGASAAFRVNNGGSASTVASASSLGYFAAMRADNANERLRFNKTALGAVAVASQAVVSTSVWILGRNAAGFSTLQTSVGFIGGAISDAESDAAYDAILTYLQAVGAA